MEEPTEQQISTEFENGDAQTEETAGSAENETVVEQQEGEPSVKTENGNEEESSEKKTEDDEDDRKLFIGGLSWETQMNTLKDYMSQYGEVETCTIKMDSKTGRSRCFGFVIFKEVDSVDKVLETKPHKVDGREIDAKKAEPQRREGKLFVGGIKPETTDAFLREYFSKYGEIEKMERPYDQKNSKPKGFCFITFKKDGPIADITVKRYHELEGKSVECKHADPPSRGGFGGGRGRDGGRGGMGGWNQGFGGGYGGGGYGGGGGGYGGFGGGGFGGGGYGGGGGGYGGFGGGGFGGGGYGGGFGGGYGNFGGGGYGFGHQQSGYGKTPGGRGRHQNNYKPY